MLISSVVAHAAFLHTPYPPTPFHPRQGGKGSLTATFDFVAPNALLRSHVCHYFFVPRFHASGRRNLGSVARAIGGRAAARSGRTGASAFATTADSPIQAPHCAAQRTARNSVFGAQPPNRLLAPLSALARVERGWGIGGELNRSAGKNIGEKA
jgi:hypothetical protein